MTEVGVPGELHEFTRELAFLTHLYPRGISIAPGDARGWSNRSAACLAMKNPSGALSDATRAVAIEPEWAKARYIHALLHSHLTFTPLSELYD